MTMNLLIYKATAMMTPTFNARISGNNLIASLNDDTPIFSLNVSEDPSFWIEGGTLMVSLNTDSSHPVYRALDYKEAEQLLSVITLVLCNRKPKMKWKNTILPAAALLVTCFAVWRFAPAPPHRACHRSDRQNPGMPPQNRLRHVSRDYRSCATLRRGTPILATTQHGMPMMARRCRQETQPGLLQPGRLPWPARKR
ncbi:hypothetical protein [Klebsiella pneumoniae]|uniref:hypothetical protein n=1 Tax=Klebsiella pneumoniae TaxID=573 RepID=UPI0012F711CF|nr:hypothetical protein [Klebsiella pneumoniae]MCS5801815.1 hypothetical protein [Klebsiella pneumoniae subsp. pneumoniae]